MLTSDELQKLSEEAEARAKEARRSNYINEHAPKPAILSGDIEGILLLIGAGSYVLSFVIWPAYLFVFLLFMLTMVALSRGVAWQRDRYQKKTRKVEADFDELLKKESLLFRTAN